MTNMQINKQKRNKNYVSHIIGTTKCRNIYIIIHV